MSVYTCGWLTRLIYSIGSDSLPKIPGGRGMWPGVPVVPGVAFFKPLRGPGIYREHDGLTGGNDGKSRDDRDF